MKKTVRLRQGRKPPAKGARRRGGGDPAGQDYEEETPLTMLGGNPARREAFEENLQALFKSFLMPPGQGERRGPSYFHTHYLPSPGESFHDVLLKALLATYDPGVPNKPYRISLRKFLRTDLPAYFRSKRVFPRPPGPKSRLSLQEQVRVRPACQALLRLCKENRLTPESAYETLVRFFPNRRRFSAQRWEKLEREIINSSHSDFHKARDALACLLSVSRSTIDDLYAKFGKSKGG